MNDLGWALAWLSVRVTVLLAPALVLQNRAARRGPGSGGWVAAWSLGLVVALGGATFWPERDPGRGPTAAPSVPASIRPGSTGAAGNSNVESAPRPGPGRPFDWRGAWDRLGQRASGPARAARPWGGVIAAAVLGGMAVGLLRLVVGLAAIAACRRRGGRVDDPALLDLINELRGAIGVRRPVEIREVADLATAATAGWLRPILLLPTHWRDWTEGERRAVLAHELAHVARGDYATGLLGRVAVALNTHHPLVWWMDARLRLEQEQAADALAARHAGGRAGYLVALAGLALKQDGRSPTWPARAFLPARGTLIRRIAMLKQDAVTDRSPVHPVRRFALAAGLLALAALAASGRGPSIAQAGDEPAAPAPPAAPPVEVAYVSDQATGVLSLRPAAASRLPGMARFVRLIREEFGIGEDMNATEFTGMAAPGAPKLRSDQIESVVVGFDIKPGRKNPKVPADAPALHALEIHGATVRAVAPFDWSAFLRGCGMTLEEIRDGRHISYKLTSKLLDELKLPLFAFLPDDRTLVIDGDPDQVKTFMSRAVPSAPAFLRGADWARASQGVFALAIDNAGDRFVKEYDLKAGRADDAVVLQLLDGVDRWVISLADADQLTLRAEATARTPETAGDVGRALDALVKQGQALLAAVATPADATDPDALLAVRLLGSLKVAVAGAAVTLDAPDFGTDADLAALLNRFDPPADARDRKPTQPPAGKP